jgi:hypothetical protein
MAKGRKHTQQRSKGERLNWSVASQGNDRMVSRNALAGRFLTPVKSHDRDGHVQQRNDVKQLVP